MPIELLIALTGIALFLIGKYGFPKTALLPKTTGPATTPTSPTTSAAPTTGSRNWMKPASWGMLTLYGLVLGIMIMMLIWIPTSWLSTVGDIYQTIAVSMALLGAFLLAAMSDKRFQIALMAAAYLFLAFNKPEETAATVERAKAHGITAAIPKQAPSVTFVTWESGKVYPIRVGEVFEGTVSASGVIFDQPSKHCVHANAIGGAEAEYVPAGHKDNIWDKVQVVPKQADRDKVFKVWIQKCL